MRILDRRRWSWRESIGIVALWGCLLFGTAGCEADDVKHRSRESTEDDREEKTYEPRSVDVLFEGTVPTVPVDAIDGIDLGQSLEEVRAQIPGTEPTSPWFVLPATESFVPVEVRAGVHSGASVVETLEIIFPGSMDGRDVRERVLGLATDQWGEADAVFDQPPTDTHCWFNPDDGVRACTDTGVALPSTDRFIKTIEFVRYAPVEQFVGTDDEAFGFQEGPIVGVTLEELWTNYPEELEVVKMGASGDEFGIERIAEDGNFEEAARKADFAELDLLPTEFEVGTTEVRLDFADDGTVEQFSFVIPVKSGLESWQQKFYRVFESKFGPPEEKKVRGIESRQYGDDPVVEIKQGTELSLQVTVGESS